jgi:multiple sugar transport system ATP-binding protein
MIAAAMSGVSKSFGKVRALQDVSFEVQYGELFCIVGPTNAGKSTLLKTMAGLHRPDAGKIAIDGWPANDLEPRERGVSLLFQNIALFPTLTGFGNIAFPLRAAKVPEAEIAARVQAIARMLKIEHLLDRLPRTFSGGEQQRTAIGRAIVHPVPLLLLDEPLTNLDARIRIALRMEFKKLHRDTGRTMLYVTHDQVEAMSLSDRIAVLHEGRFQQIGTPDEIYHQPRTRFVARFIGTPPMNILPAELGSEAGAPLLLAKGFTVRLPPADLPSSLPRRVGLGVRPEAIRAAPARSDATPHAGEVIWVEHLGPKSILDVRLGDELVKVMVRPDAAVDKPGPAWFGFDARADRLLDLETDVFLR